MKDYYDKTLSSDILIQQNTKVFYYTTVEVSMFVVQLGSRTF